MATKKGVWNLQQVRDKQLQDLWTTRNGTVWWLGRNEKGSAGGTAPSPAQAFSSPVQLTGDWTKLYNSGAPYESHSVAAAKGAGTLYIWGRNDYGETGTNTQNPGLSSPTQVPGTTWSNLATGKNYKLATKTDGTLWSWGRNHNGYLGLNNEADYSSPVQVPGTTWGTTQGKLAAGEMNSAVIRTDGTLWVMGANGNGQLGLNDTNKRSSPTQVPGTTWSQVSGKVTNRVAAIKTDGTLWGWGYNIVGELGVNNRTYYSSPVQIFGTQTNWAQVAVGNNHIGAVNTDGELWVCGTNTYGDLGQNNRTKYSSPVQVPGTTWSQEPGALKIGAISGACLKTDGTLWWFGYTGIGQLGLNSPASSPSHQYSSPVQVGGGMDWSSNFYDQWWSTDGSNFVVAKIVN